MLFNTLVIIPYQTEGDVAKKICSWTRNIKKHSFHSYSRTMHYVQMGFVATDGAFTLCRGFVCTPIIILQSLWTISFAWVFFEQNTNKLASAAAETTIKKGDWIPADLYKIRSGFCGANYVIHFNKNWSYFICTHHTTQGSIYFELWWVVVFIPFKDVAATVVTAEFLTFCNNTERETDKNNKDR